MKNEQPLRTWTIQTSSPEETHLLAEQLGMLLQPGDVVLVKGSLGSRMGQIVDALLRSVDALDQAANGR